VLAMGIQGVECEEYEEHEAGWSAGGVFHSAPDSFQLAKWTVTPQTTQA